MTSPITNSFSNESTFDGIFLKIDGKILKEQINISMFAIIGVNMLMLTVF